MKSINSLGKIILASKSPRREEILSKINLNFDIAPSNIDEKLDIKLDPATYVQNCANKKACKVSLSYKENTTHISFSLCSDIKISLLIQT